METVLVQRRIAAPVAAVWQALALVLSSDAAMIAATVEVLGGQPPTLLSFRLLSGAPVRRNVVAVQLRPGTPGTTELCVESAFQTAPTGLTGRARRRMRHLLLDLTASVATVARPGDRAALDPLVATTLTASGQ